jgi:hypothetical protein
MRLLSIALMLGLLFVSVTLADDACDPLGSSHTNPPILLRKGNSLNWFVCDVYSQEWTRIPSSYNVFTEDGKCDEANQYLDDRFFGEGVDKNKPATLYGLSSVWHPDLEGDDYKLKIDYRRKRPAKYKLCKINGPCCKLAPDADRRGTIPHEFETFDEDKISYGWLFTYDGTEPLTFRTCKYDDCEHMPAEPKE